MGLPAYVRNAIKCGPVPKLRNWRELPLDKLTRAERNMLFCETYCLVPEGDWMGRKVKLLPFQEAFFYALFDNPRHVRRAYLSMARKNGKTALIAMLLLLFIVGPEAKENSRIDSGALSREQAGQVFIYASKMIRLSPELSAVSRIVDSSKRIIGILMNVTYEAIAAEGKTTHGRSPLVAILDETGQVEGSRGRDVSFIEAVTTSQGAYGDKALLIVISTQAPTDGDLLSQWLDDAEEHKPDNYISHVYSAPEDCDLNDESAWQAANPALGAFRSKQDVKDQSDLAIRVPSNESGFRVLTLNQRVDINNPFLPRRVWEDCAEMPKPLEGLEVFGGLDLSECNDLTGLVLDGVDKEGFHNFHCNFWLPEEGIRDRSRNDRVPYDLWARDGHLKLIPGKTVNYAFVAQELWELSQRVSMRLIYFDSYNFRHLQPWLLKAGFTQEQIDGDAAIFKPMRQGTVTMHPALRSFEELALNQKIRHGGHPVMNMCMANAIPESDSNGNRKLSKGKSRGRIDGAVCGAMAVAAAATFEDNAAPLTPWDLDENFSLADL